MIKTKYMIEVEVKNGGGEHKKVGLLRSRVITDTFYQALTMFHVQY